MATKEFQANLMNLQSNLFNFALMLTSDRDRANDLVQDTTLKVLTNEDSYVDTINFKGWVFTIMRNTFVNQYRAHVRSATIIDQTEDLYHLNLPQESGIDTPEGSLSVNEITDAIQELGEDFRVPFTMHLSGYKYQEIADKLDLPLGTVKSRIFIARKNLQTQFADYR